MNVIECPKCDQPVSGRECSNCGVNPHTADFGDCFICGDTNPVSDMETITTTDDFGNRNNKHLCDKHK